MNPKVQEKLHHFFSQFAPATFTDGQTIISPGDLVNDVYFLTEGKVRMYSVSSEGEETTLHFFERYSYFPIMLLLSNKSNDSFFEASENVTAFKAPAKEVLKFIQGDPQILFDLVTRFSYAINGLTKRIELIAHENAYERVSRFLVYLTSKFGSPITMSHEELASWLGLQRETVSRQITKMQKEGLIKTQNKKIWLVDIQKLQV